MRRGIPARIVWESPRRRCHPTSRYARGRRCEPIRLERGGSAGTTVPPQGWSADRAARAGGVDTRRNQPVGRLLRGGGRAGGAAAHALDARPAVAGGGRPATASATTSACSPAAVCCRRLRLAVGGRLLRRACGGRVGRAGVPRGVDRPSPRGVLSGVATGANRPLLPDAPVHPPQASQGRGSAALGGRQDRSGACRGSATSRGWRCGRRRRGRQRRGGSLEASGGRDSPRWAGRGVPPWDRLCFSHLACFLCCAFRGPPPHVFGIRKHVRIRPRKALNRASNGPQRGHTWSE